MEEYIPESSQQDIPTQSQQIISLVTQYSERYKLNRPHTEKLMVIAKRKRESISELPEILEKLAITFSTLQNIGEPIKSERGAARYGIRLPRNAGHHNPGRNGTSDKSYQARGN